MEHAERARIVVLTPSLAQEWLTRPTTDVRPMVPTRARRIARWILSGDARLTWDMIAFDPDGRRLNGQHRCQGMVWAGEVAQERGLPEPSMRVWVALDMDPASCDVGDQGLKRTPADVLRNHGEANPKPLAATLRLLWHWQTGRAPGARDSASAPDIPDYLATLREHPNVREHVAPGMRLNDGALMSSDALGIWASYLFTRVDPAEAEDFLDRLEAGNDLQDGDAILALRQHFVDLRKSAATSKGSDVTRKAAALVIAFNRQRNAEPTTVTQLRWRPGGRQQRPFPIIEPAADALVDGGL